MLGRSRTASALRKPSISAPRSWPPRSRKEASSSPSSPGRTPTSSRRRSSRGVRPQQPLVLLVGHRVDARPQLRQPPQPRAVLDHLHVPAGRLEHAGQAAGGDVRHHAVERLAVEVDHPHDLAELGHHRVGDRLPDGALVELGVTDQRDLAAADRHVEVPGHVAVRERAPDRRRRADPDRARRVVDGVGILGPRRVGLQPAELPQRGQVLPVEPPQQVVDGVQDGRRVRLHAHPVRRLEDREPQRGHQRHHRGARRLMAADLHPRGVRPDPVGVVHDRRRQPQHAPLHAVEDREVELGWAGAPAIETVCGLLALASSCERLS